MANKKMEFIIYTDNNSKIKAMEGYLPIIKWKEKNHYVAYSPSIDLSTSAKSLAQLNKRINKVLQIFFSELIKMGTLEEVLTENGWQKIIQEEEYYKCIPPEIITSQNNQIHVKIH